MALLSLAKQPSDLTGYNVQCSFPLSAADLCSFYQCLFVPIQQIRPRLEVRSIKVHAFIVMFMKKDLKKMFLFVNFEQQQDSNCIFLFIHSFRYAPRSLSKRLSKIELTPQRSKILNDNHLLKIQKLYVIISRLSSPHYQPSFVSISWDIVPFRAKHINVSGDVKSS